jgi:hypothetical protein
VIHYFPPFIIRISVLCGSWNGSNCLHIVECFLLQSRRLCCLLNTPADTGKNRILCATSDDMFHIFEYMFRFLVAMELPCGICTAKDVSKERTC